MHAWTHPRVVTMLFFGFSAGVPILLIFSSLSLWLRESGVSRSAVTFFSWAALGYSFKFIWAPLIDTLPLPILTKRLGRRRSWLLVAQCAVITAICIMAMTDPAAGQHNLTIMAMAAVLLGFSSATQDIVIDAYRIECAEKELQALLSSTYIAGYRIGMLVAGAGALYLASWFGTSREVYNYQAWQYSYFFMAGVMLIGVATTLLISEPETTRTDFKYSTSHYLRFVLLFIVSAATFATVFFLSSSPVASLKEWVGTNFPGNDTLISFGIETARLGVAVLCSMATAYTLILFNIADRDMAKQTYINPIADFFNRYGGQTALLLLALIGLYRISDIVLGVISNVFYQDLGFSKPVIASVIKTFGLFMTLAGGFLGGMLTLRYGVIKILFLGAVLSSLTNLLFLLLASIGDNVTVLTMVIAADNLSAGIATTAFELLGGYSGTMVTAWGYEWFFLLTTLMGGPVLILIWLAGKRLMADG